MRHKAGEHHRAEEGNPRDTAVVESRLGVTARAHIAAVADIMTAKACPASALMIVNNNPVRRQTA